MSWIEGQIFQDEVVAVDGQSYRDCRFSNTTLTYAAGIIPTFADCQFENVSLEFGDAACNTIAFLTGLHQGGLSRSVELIFDSIRMVANDEDSSNADTDL